MIKNYQKVELPKVNLGNLGLHNACSYYVPKDPKEYPKCFFGKKLKKGERWIMQADKPENCLKGFQINEQWDNPYERLVDYAFDLQEEHKDLTDEQINHPADFIGRKRSAGWEDERRRRGLIN